MRTAMTAVLVCAAVAAGGQCLANDVYWVPMHQMAPQEHIGYQTTSGDLDHDGDTDLTFGFAEYWNIGTAEDPAWLFDTGTFTGVAYCHDGMTALGDVDSDGDLDLVTTCRYIEDGRLHLYENVGTAAHPSWLELEGAFDGTSLPVGPIEPSLADIDGDGDLDLFLADDFRHMILVENVGTPASPEWVQSGYVTDVVLAAGSRPCADLGDLDGDGDLDILVVGDAPPARCWENIGTPTVSSFAENPAMLTGVDAIASGHGVELFDIDGDSDEDLLISGGIYVMQNLLYLNDQIVPVGPATWGRIKALYR